MVELEQNISTLWLTNIFNNLKALENIERLAREGCSSITDYIQIPPAHQNIILVEAQYKNLRFFVFELEILLTNLTQKNFKLTNEGDYEKYRKYLLKICVQGAELKISRQQNSLQIL